MLIWIVVATFMENGYFGCYSSIPNARAALENFFNGKTNFKVIDIGNYTYAIHNLANGEVYTVEIISDNIDADVPEKEENND